MFFFSFLVACSAMAYMKDVDSDGHTVFVGLGDGQIQEFKLSSDLNRFERKKILESMFSKTFIFFAE